MAKQKNGINKSAAIRDLYKEKPEIKVSEVVSTLAAKGIKVSDNLVYLVKGTLKGAKSHRQQVNRTATSVATASGSTNTVATIIEVKALAVKVGGLANLKALVDALMS